MNREYNLNDIVEEAKSKGYFAFEDYPKLRLNPQEMLELMKQLSKKNIPLGSPEDQKPVSVKQATEIINSLRRGIPSSDGTSYYSVGQEELISEVKFDLSKIEEGKSIVRFLNADIGEGKTHTLYRLREIAYQHDFAVSIVTLSQNSCPLYDFMTVYHDIMWGLRTSDQRSRPALTNIFDRWVNDIRRLDVSKIYDIVQNQLPPTLRDIMAAYVDASNLIRPNEIKRQQIIKFLGGEKISKRDLKIIGINSSIDSYNALQILSEVSIAIQFIGFKGICIFFDEAESIHSFARSTDKDKAYSNLQQIIKQSQSFPHCYFLYATTPSFLNSFDNRWIRQLYSKPFLTLEVLDIGKRQEIGEKIVDLYSCAYEWNAPPKVVKAINIAARLTEGVTIGNYIRKVIGILDEKMGQNE